MPRHKEKTLNNDTLPKQRTNQQSKAIHLFCKMLADTLNNSGLDQRKVLKPSINIPWTKDSVKKQIWHPIQEAMFNTDSTIFLHKQGQIDAIHKVIMRELGEKHSVEWIDFPVDKKRQYEKYNYGEYHE